MVGTNNDSECLITNRSVHRNGAVSSSTSNRKQLLQGILAKNQFFPNQKLALRFNCFRGLRSEQHFSSKIPCDNGLLMSDKLPSRFFTIYLYLHFHFERFVIL